MPEPSRRRRGVAHDVEALIEQGLRLQAVEARLKAERKTAAALAKEFHEAGVSKRAIAEALGITRVTLDAWLKHQDDARPPGR